MAKTVKKKSIHTAKKKYTSPFGIYWEKKNYLFLFLGFALLILGYFVMSMGDWDSFPSLVISPIILFIAYILIFPASILYRKKESEKPVDQEAAAKN
ncbi:MAG: hypothetical protein R6W90_08920 [Ignavibacteriaceae bacterium]